MSDELVRCSHKFLGKKLFKCNDPISGIKLQINCEQGVLAILPRYIAEENTGVFTIVGGIEAPEEAEKVDPPDDADDAKIDPPVADDGDENPPDGEIPPAPGENPNPPADDKKEEPPAGPDESEQANAELKAQIEGFKSRSELDEFAETLKVKLDGRKSLKKMKAALISALEL